MPPVPPAPPARAPRIALLSPRDWPEVRRGTERFARELGAALSARGARPTLITSRRGTLRIGRERSLRTVAVPRLPEGRLERRRHEEHLGHLPFSSIALHVLRPDVGHALYATDGLVAARWSKRTGQPAVFSCMGIPNRAWLGERRRRPEILRAAAAGSRATVALSAAAARALEHWLGIEARVIPAGVDLEAFRPGAARAADPTILCAAAVGEPRKRVALLVEAFSLVRGRIPQARLELSRPADPAAAAALGPLPDGVVWRDLDDRATLARANATAWVAVLPSSEEAFGLVLLEALACGTPVVGSRTGGIPEVIGDQAVGRLFDGDDPTALADALAAALELAADGATPARCRARAEGFSWARCVEAYASLYRELGVAGI